MNEWVFDNWIVVVIALLLAALAIWWLLAVSRRTRVAVDRRDALDEGAGPATRNQALIDAPPVAARPEAPLPPMVPEAVGAAGIAVAAGAQEAGKDNPGEQDLTRIKGLGPKLVATLKDLGVTRLGQIAAWTEEDIDRIDPQLGRFQGRIRRDEWVEQARLLTSGDEARFNSRFGAG